MFKHKKVNLILKKILIIFVWLAIWQSAAVLTGLDFLIAGPVNVFMALIKLLKTRVLYLSVVHTFTKVTAGFVIAFLSGSLLGSMSGKCNNLRLFLQPLLYTIQTLPVASFIILLLIWFGSSSVAFLISFIVVFPMIYNGFLSAMDNLDIKLEQMSDVFGVPLLKKIRCVYLSQLMSDIQGTLKSAVSMGFKAGVSAEVIGLVKNSIGEQIYYSKLYMTTADLFAWSIVLIFISIIFEHIFIKCINGFTNFVKRP